MLEFSKLKNSTRLLDYGFSNLRGLNLALIVVLEVFDLN